MKYPCKPVWHIKAIHRDLLPPTPSSLSFDGGETQLGALMWCLLLGNRSPGLNWGQWRLNGAFFVASQHSALVPPGQLSPSSWCRGRRVQVSARSRMWRWRSRSELSNRCQGWSHMEQRWRRARPSIHRCHARAPFLNELRRSLFICWGLLNHLTRQKEAPSSPAERSEKNNQPPPPINVSYQTD